jgi:polyhydroxyalkanoate synthase
VQQGLGAIPILDHVGNFLRLYENLDDPAAVKAWHAMNTWVSDNIPMAGGAFRQLIVDFYRQNLLIENRLIIRGERVDLTRISANLLTVIAEDDHITPPCQSETIIEKVGSADKELFRLPGGHIGIMAGSGAKKHAWPHIDGWLGTRSD